MLLYSRKKVRYRRDGYCWKKRKDGKTTREDHMKLKVQGMEVTKFLCLLISLARNVKCLFTNKTRASSISPILYITEREARSFKLKLI